MRLVSLRTAAFSLIVLATSCQARDVVKISEFQEPDRLVPESIVIVSWNAPKGQSAQFKTDLSRLVIGDRPDFVFLQEARADLLAFERWGTTGIGSQLEDLTAVMEEHAGPIILVGDFNTWSHKRLALVQKVADRLNLTEVTGFPPGRKAADKEASFLNWLFGTDEELPLDRVYYRGFVHHSAKVLPYESSDHTAIQVTLDLESPSPGPAD